MRAGAAGIDGVYRTQHIAEGAYPGIDQFRAQSTPILDRAAGLLDRVRAARPDLHADSVKR